MFARAHEGGTGFEVSKPTIALCAEEKSIYIANQTIGKWLVPTNALYVGPDQRIIMSEEVAVLFLR
jgi:hypothetical protein